MGRKKRKAVELDPENDEELAAYMPPKDEAPAPVPAADTAAAPTVVEEPGNTTAAAAAAAAPPASSSYAVTSHSAEIVGEDIYVSDGSEGEEEERADVVLAGSRMGLMRRVLYHPSLLQPNRQWQREIQNETTETLDKEEEEKRKQELAKSNPLEYARQLLIEKTRKLEEAKEAARLNESEENAGRDPCLFSKRTAFDIRMDQIEEKPWNNGADITDYFNYNMGQLDWEEYSANQLLIRQELTDASRQRRPPDPNIVPVTPKTPLKQAPRVAVAVRDPDDTTDGNDSQQPTEGPAIGPDMVDKDDKMDVDKEGDEEKKDNVSDIGGGAWGAGAAPGSMLAKLIEEQEQKNSAAETAAPPPFQQQDQDDRYSYYGGSNGGQDHYSPPPPSPLDARRGGHFPPNHGSGPPPPSYRGRGRGGFRPHGPPDMPPPWAGRAYRGGFRGRGGRGYGRF